MHFDQVKSRAPRPAHDLDRLRLATGRTLLRNLLSRLANAHPLMQSLAVVTVLLLAAAVFEGWGLVFGSSPKHHVAKPVAAATPTPSPSETPSDLPAPTETAAPVPVTSTVATAQGQLVVARTEPNAKAKVIESL